MQVAYLVSQIVDFFPVLYSEVVPDVFVLLYENLIVFLVRPVYVLRLGDLCSERGYKRLLLLRFGVSIEFRDESFEIVWFRVRALCFSFSKASVVAVSAADSSVTFDNSVSSANCGFDFCVVTVEFSGFFSSLFSLSFKFSLKRLLIGSQGEGLLYVAVADFMTFLILEHDVFATV